MKEDDLCDGFLLGIAVAKSLSFKDDFDRIFAQLRAVAAGELSLLPAIEEEIQAFMKVIGRPPTPREMETYRSATAQSRSQQDARHKEQAEVILGRMHQQRTAHHNHG